MIFSLFLGVLLSLISVACSQVDAVKACEEVTFIWDGNRDYGFRYAELRLETVEYTARKVQGVLLKDGKAIIEFHEEERIVQGTGKASPIGRPNDWFLQGELDPETCEIYLVEEA